MTDSKQKTSKRWTGRTWLIIVVSGGGLAAVGLAAWLSTGVLSLQEFTVGVLINIGTTLALAALLIWFEKKLEQSQNRSVAAAATEAATQAAEQVAEQFGTRVRDLDTEVDAVVSHEDAQMLESIASLGDTVSYEGLCDALRAAVELGAIDAGRGIIVPAGATLQSPRVQFKLVEEGRTDENYWGEEISVSFVSTDGKRAHVSWAADSGATIKDIFRKLVQVMRREGFGPESGKLSASSALKILSKGLREAMAARMGTSDAAYDAITLYEILQDGWLLTSEGIYVRGAGVILDPGDFYDPYEPFDPIPKKPAIVVDGAWPIISARASEQFGKYNRPGAI